METSELMAGNKVRDEYGTGWTVFMLNRMDDGTLQVLVFGAAGMPAVIPAKQLRAI